MEHTSAKDPAGRETVRPFLKWAGGKGQLLGELRRYYPFSDSRFVKYAEPFVGGGAVLFDILSRYDLQEVYISDTNEELINAYLVVRDQAAALIEFLQACQEEYLPLDAAGRKAYYAAKRSRFNELKAAGRDGARVEKAALMIFLNRTCFNGLYRVNRKGLFNVPMGAYRNPLICDRKNLLAVSEKLRDVTIACGDYKQSASFIDARTFVYFDPPYRPLTDTANFTAYTENLFDDGMQRELAEFVDSMHRRGAKIVVSNSDPRNANAEDDFFDSIYSTHKIKRVEAARMINCNTEARGKIRELLISNFDEGPDAGREEAAREERRTFDSWLAGFRGDIASYEFYTDFQKIYRNVDSLKLELNLLNALIGSRNIRGDFQKLLTRYPEVLKCLPLLLAARKTELHCQDETGGLLYRFTPPALSCVGPEDCARYSRFMEKTGLFDLLENHLTGSLADYVTGVEAGLDSNARKNRRGHVMEDLVEGYIQRAGFVKGRTYFKEMTTSQITRRWNIDLSAISNRGRAKKRFDFVVKTEGMIYGVETNFYGGKGSKLNETARSYKTLALEAAAIDGFTFVWFTDGKGWLDARNNLEETFDVLPTLYNLSDLENGVIERVFK